MSAPQSCYAVIFGVMNRALFLAFVLAAFLAFVLAACGDDSSGVDAGRDASVDTPGVRDTGADVPQADTNVPEGGFDFSNPYDEGNCAVPPEGAAEDISSPRTVVGDGTPGSCTSESFVAAVDGGGVITFNCGPEPVVIELMETAKVRNDASEQVVIDGGGVVTLSGRGERRILYMNTCDQDQVWTTPHCDNQDHPRLTVQNIRLIGGNSSADSEYTGGGAIWSRGGQLKLVNVGFESGACADTGPDLGGAAVRVFDQYEDRPVYVSGCTFGGSEAVANVCSNGGGISSIGVSWNIYNSLFSYNRAIGNGGNPAMPGTPGGGSGGAIYNDGNTMTLSLCGTRIEHNSVVQHGSAIFFVSNDHSGNVRIENSNITNNTGGSWYPTYPQISGHSDTPIEVIDSVIE